MVDDSLLTSLVSTAEHDDVRQLVVGAVVQHNSQILLLQRPSDPNPRVAP